MRRMVFGVVQEVLSERLGRAHAEPRGQGADLGRAEESITVGSITAGIVGGAHVF